MGFDLGEAILYGTVAGKKGGTPAQSLVIQASHNVTINTYVVPALSAEQIIQAYNTIVAGGSVVISDALGMTHLTVGQANEIAGEISIVVYYFDHMVLTYKEDETITYKVLS